MLKKKPKSGKSGKNLREKREGGLELVGQVLAGVVESGFLMAAADGEIADEEVALLVGLIAGFTEGAATEEEISGLIQACDESLGRDGFPARIQAAAANLTTKELRHQGLLCAALVLAADDRFDEENEGAFYVDYANALGIGREEALAVLSEARDIYEG